MNQHLPEIPFVDLSRQHSLLSNELAEAFARVTRRSTFTLGEEVEQFEHEFALYCGVEHCVGVASGTAALQIALSAAGIGPGDEVIVPAHTFIATAFSVIQTGATPVLCDVHTSTGLLDLRSAATVFTSRTAAIIPVHLYGQACAMSEIRAFAESHGLLVFEDAAQAHGATYQGCRTGSLGDAASFSFYPSKNLGALGDGGAITTNNSQLAEQARALRNLGQLQKGEHLLNGTNERLDGLQAAFLRAKLPYLDQSNQLRREHAMRYRDELSDAIKLLPDQGEGSVHHLFPIRVEDRAIFADHLAAAGVQTGVHYHPALHQQPPLAPWVTDAADFPHATAWAEQELSLPMFPELQVDEISRVVTACNEIICAPV